QERGFLNLALGFGLLKFGRLVEILPNIKRQEYRNDTGHENDSPAVGDHGFFGSQERNQGENQRAENIAEGEARLDEAANHSALVLRSIFNGEGVAHGIFATEEDSH